MVGQDGQAGSFTALPWVGPNFTHQYSADPKMADTSTKFIIKKTKK